jgi:DNA-binding NarL/FixJ family response regulator
MSVRVLIVDDQELLRAGIALILRAQPDIEVVGEADDGEAAVRLARSLRPDVVLMDVRMPHIDGIEATRRILADPGAAGTHVLVLTTFDLDDYVYDALRAGASGFLLKDAPSQQLVDGIRMVAHGDALLAPSVTRRLIEDTVRRRHAPSASHAALLEALTGREREVLELLARGLTNGDVAAALVVSEATVKTHVSHVFAKLGLHDRAQAVVFAYEAGVVDARADRDAQNSASSSPSGVEGGPSA